MAEIALFLLIGTIVVVSLYGFSNYYFTQKYLFSIASIHFNKQWDCLLTSSFLHADGMHLFFNMYTLYMFAPSIIEDKKFGLLMFFCIYFGAVITGGLLSYFMNKHNYTYRALGASGGVTGIVMAFAIINPNDGIGIIFIPGYIPGYIFGFLYLIYSIYSMHNKHDNIGHEAHLGGAVFGMLIPILLHPSLLIKNFFEVGLLLLPLVYLAYYIYQRRKQNR